MRIWGLNVLNYHKISQPVRYDTDMFLKGFVRFTQRVNVSS